MKKLDEQILIDISRHIGIPEAFLEKDWYLVHSLNLIQSANTNELQVVFSGGTSLSKGYGLIKRFSEDIDFMVCGAEKLKKRDERSEFKHTVIDKINENNFIWINPETLKSRDKNQFCKFYIDYPEKFREQNSLRKGIKTEISFKPTFLKPIVREVTTIVGKYIKDAPTAVIPCVSPVETAANKFCALMWRLSDHYKNYSEKGENDHPNLVRHLHDLSALYTIIMENFDTFISLVDIIYDNDVKRAEYEITTDFVNFVEQTYNILNKNEIYKQNYKDFVNNMYQVPDKANIISFETALSDFENLCNFVIDQKQENRPTM